MGPLELYCSANVKKIRQKDFNRGPTRVLMEEAQLHFDTLEAAKKWAGMLMLTFDKGLNRRAWSSDGLYIRWSYVIPEYWFFPKRGYLHIRILQLYVKGNRPTDLPGALNNKIKVERLTDDQLREFQKY